MEKKLPSLIIHTSSMTALVPTPFAAVFSATKIFGDFMAEGLQYELQRFNVDISIWRMGDIAKGPKEETSLMKPSPEMYVEAAMGKCTSGVHYGYLSHEVMGLIIENLLDIVP